MGRRTALIRYRSRSTRVTSSTTMVFLCSYVALDKNWTGSPQPCPIVLDSPQDLLVLQPADGLVYRCWGVKIKKGIELTTSDSPAGGKINLSQI